MRLIRTDSSGHIPGFDFALNEGLRFGEMHNLNWEDINLHQSVATAPLSKSVETRHAPRIHLLARRRKSEEA